MNASCRCRVRGQALVEFLVATAALVPLFAGIVVIGRLQDLRVQTLQSARYAAFARAFGVRPADVESEVRRRFFGEPASAVVATDARDGAETDTTANAHWADPMRSSPAFVGRAADVTVAIDERVPAGTAAGVLQRIAATAESMAAWTGGRFDVERRGDHRVGVRVRLAELPSVAAAQPLVLTATAQVFGGDWSADGPDQTGERTAALAPATMLRRVRTVFASLDWALALFEPAFRDLCLGRIDVELVPADRLGPPGSGDAGTWVAPCS